ncbi:MAG: ampG protein [Rickettsiaceae bacterium]|jgi:PAT family beta-lactamase induction signal transducer AmpG|nr:ampG protein [Rickettsiaceae bacterium]
MALQKNLLLNIFTDKRLFIILILSMISAMPYAIIVSMLSTWLKKLGVALTAIGLFSIAKSPYSFKFTWAPLVDHYKLPVLFKLLGRRRSWMLLANIGVIISLAAIKLTDPLSNINLTLIMACSLGFFAATYDAAFDAFRIESLEENMQAMGVSTTMLGYRLGLISISAGSLFVAGKYSWDTAFLYAGILFLIGTIFIIFSSEPKSEIIAFQGINFEMFNRTVIEPFRDLFKREYSIIIFSTVALYKLGEAMLSSMAKPFYIETGFTLDQIGVISGFYGPIATLVGAYLGALVSAKVGNLKSLMICGTGQMLSNLMFVWQNHMGADPSALMLTLTIENVTGGMGSAALIGYMSSLCNKKYTGTHYALLTSFAALANSTLTTSSGFLVESMGWDMFFIFTTIISLPALLLVKHLDKKMK